MKKDANMKITRRHLRRIIREVCQLDAGDEIIDEDDDTEDGEPELEEGVPGCPGCQVTGGVPQESLPLKPEDRIPRR